MREPRKTRGTGWDGLLTRPATTSLTIGLCIGASARASDTIDFESLPDGTPVSEGMIVSDQWEAAFGVRFETAEGGHPIIAKVGSPWAAFFGPAGLPYESNGCRPVEADDREDKPAPGQPYDLGCYFLTVDGAGGSSPETVVARYSTPVFEASGVILDIDGDEEWTLRALDQSGVVVATLVIEEDRGGDGIATPWSFDLSEQIWAVEFGFTGQGTAVGLAMDLFSPASAEVPEEWFCFCDSNGVAPCGNEGEAGHGCGNGSFSGGSRLSATGRPGVSADSLVLEIVQTTPTQPGLLFQGDNAINGGGGVQFGDGLRCVGGGVVRLEIVTADGAGFASSTTPIGQLGGVTAGDTKYYQWWYRDPSGSPCGAGFNLSNGLVVTWAP